MVFAFFRVAEGRDLLRELFLLLVSADRFAEEADFFIDRTHIFVDDWFLCLFLLFRVCLVCLLAENIVIFGRSGDDLGFGVVADHFRLAELGAIRCVFCDGFADGLGVSGCFYFFKDLLYGGTDDSYNRSFIRLLLEQAREKVLDRRPQIFIPDLERSLQDLVKHFLIILARVKQRSMQYFIEDNAQ